MPKPSRTIRQPDKKWIWNPTTVGFSDGDRTKHLFKKPFYLVHKLFVLGVKIAHCTTLGTLLSTKMQNVNKNRQSRV
jgi:hypothetical protein